MSHWVESLDYERGPIRPPSEARSLFLRVVRNCPWNRCAFCPVYKNQPFEIRSIDDIAHDLMTISRMLGAFRNAYPLEISGSTSNIPVSRLGITLFGSQYALSDSCRAVLSWYGSGGKHVFLQDADALTMKPAHLEWILQKIREFFPFVRRITAYSRSATTERLGFGILQKLQSAGLNRIHSGLESGDETLLSLMQKGASPETHIRGGKVVREAGMELSLYVMPGLGGLQHSVNHAVHTAAIISRIEPDVVRLRTLTIVPGTPLYDMWRSNAFTPLTDSQIISEIRLFLTHLDVSRGHLVSDHTINLLPELEGRLPDEIPAMIRIIDRFLDMPSHDRTLYQIGRRIGIFRNLSDIQDPFRREIASRCWDRLNDESIDPDTAIREWTSEQLL